MYNPGVTYQGGELMARGISQAGNALSDGLQRYAANKEESAALDTRFESTAKPLMEKLRLYGQLADENSPAAALLDKSADWHKLGTSQKKVLLADMMLLGDKTEAEQRRKQEDQWKLLAEQHHQAQEDLAQKQFWLAQGREGREAASALWNMGNQWWDNRRADSHLALAQQQEADRQRAAEEQLRRFAKSDAAITGMNQDVAQALATQAAVPGAALPLTRDRFLGLAAKNNALLHPQLDNLLRYVDTSGVDADHVPKMTTLGGANVIYSPKGGQFQLAPNFELPPNLPDVPGRVPTPNGKGGVSYIPTGEISKAQRESIQSKVIDQNIKLHSLRDLATSEATKKLYTNQILENNKRLDDLNGQKPPAEPSGPNPSAAAAPSAPKVGEERKGYVFLGGDPSQQSSWRKK